MLKTIATITVIIAAGGIVWLLLRRKNSKPVKQHPHRVTVSGDAVSINGRAALRTDSTVIYYVSGMQTWEQDWIGHKVRAIGDLETEAGNGQQYIGSAVLQLMDD